MSAVSKLAAMAILLAPGLTLGAAPPAISVQVQPRELRLAEGGRVRVRIASPAEVPTVAVSVGRIENLHEVSSGIYEAQYAPPDAEDPDIAFVTAVTPGGAFGWSTVALYGSRTVELRAPHRTLVSVTVGDETYGPIPADGTGRAILRVDVPPGVYSGTSQKRRVELGVRPRGFAAVTLGRPSLEAAASGTIPVRVIALDDEGQPVARAQLKLDASDGTVSKVSEVAPGLYSATWSVRPGPVRRSTVTARIGGRLPATATATLSRGAGAAAAVEVAAEFDTLVAGERDELAVSARVVDAAGNLTDEPANLVVSLGTGPGARLLADEVIEWQKTGEGYRGRILLPRQRSGAQQLELKVVTAGGLVGTRLVNLVAGPPARLAVETDGDLYADGRRSQVRLVLLDKHGNRTESNASAVLTATRGVVGTPARHATGVYVAEYRSTLSATDYKEVLSARVGPLETRTEVLVRARGSRVVLGVKGGYAAGTGSLSSPSAALEIGFWLPSLRTSLGIVTDLRYYGFSNDQTLPAGSTTVAVGSKGTFFAIEPALAWRRPMLGGMFWLGGGPGLVHATTTVSAPGQPDLTSVSWVPSAHASVGWGLPLGPGVPFLEAKGGWQGEASGAVTGALTTITLNLGYRFNVL